MVHRHAFEAFDRSMNDIFGSQRTTDSQMLFSGKVVISNASRQDIVNASLNSSYIWGNAKS